VRTARNGGIRGYDAGKRIKGRKRHILVDTLGLVLVCVVHSASVQDRDGARDVLRLLEGAFGRIGKIWADGGYAGALVEWVSKLRRRRRIDLEIVKRSDDAKGFEVLPRRWIVERTFAWLENSRRLAKDYETTIGSSRAMIHIAMIRLMVKRLA
jgi:putative transposase